LVVVAPVQVHDEPNDVKTQVALDLHLGNLVGVFFEQNQDDLLLKVLPKRIAPRDGEASPADFTAAVEFEDD
jgi:hypothetical protein